MKKLFLSLFALSFAIAIFAQASSGARIVKTLNDSELWPENPEPTPSKDALYELNGLEYHIWDGAAFVRKKPSNKEMTTVRIPGVIKVNSGKFAGKVFPVKLKADAFINCLKLTEVVFENTLNPVTHKYVSVSSIPANAFGNCRNLKKINLHFVNNIGSFAFGDCRSLETLHIGDSIVDATNPVYIGCYAFSKCINLENVIVACKSTRQDRIKLDDFDFHQVYDEHRALKDDVYKSLTTYGWMFIDTRAFEKCDKLKLFSVIDVTNKSELSTFCIADYTAFMSNMPFKKSASYKKIAFVSGKDYYDPTDVPVKNSSSTYSSNSDAHPVKPTYSQSRTKSSKSGAHTVKSTNSNSGVLPSDAKGWYLFNGGNKIFIIYVGNNKLGQISYVNGQEDVEIGTFKYDGNALNVSFGYGVNTPLAISYRNGGWQLDLGRGCYATKSSENMVSMVYTNPRTLNYIKSYCR